MSKSDEIHLNGKVYDAASGLPIKHAKKKKPTKKPAAIKPVKNIKSDVVKVKPRSKNHKVHHKTQKSKTLARSPLNKPHKTKPKTKTQPKTAHITAKQERHDRAKVVSRSPSVAKYSHHVKKVQKRFDVVPVVQAPGGSNVRKPQTKSEKEFNRVLAEATAHQEKPHSMNIKKKRSMWKPATITFAALLLIGFFGYQNIPNLSLRIASSRAGFEAKLPEFTPNGFSTGKINYETGRVVINFSSNSSNNSYSLTEKVSGWNSQALMHNYLIDNDMKYQSQQVKGKTVYLYENSNATWVSGGVWFNIQSKGLNNDQLISIASSL